MCICMYVWFVRARDRKTRGTEGEEGIILSAGQGCDVTVGNICVKNVVEANMCVWAYNDVALCCLGRKTMVTWASHVTRGHMGVARDK